MKTILRKFLVVISLLVVTTVNAQTQFPSDLIAGRAQQKVKQMTDYISKMADKKRPVEERRDYRDLALNLFIGHGAPYELNGSTREGVMMQITSKYRSKPSMRLMKDYFNGLIRLRYSQVVITSTDLKEIKVSELKKIGEHEYECTCTFSQAFCGYRDGRPIYKDITKKRVTCHVIEEEVVSSNSDGSLNVEYEYIVLLGDVEALETC